MIKELEPLRAQIAEIEARFPPNADFDKYASINEAIIGVRLDQLGKQIEALEPKIISKWGVARIVTAVMFLVSAVATATVSTIFYFLDLLSN